MENRFDDYFVEGITLTVKNLGKPYCKIIVEDDESTIQINLSKADANLLIGSLQVFVDEK